MLFSTRLISQREPASKAAARSKNISDVKKLYDKGLTGADLQHARLLGYTRDACTIKEPF